MGQLGFLINTTQCTGCRCCQVACKDINDLPVAVFYRQVFDFEGGQFPDVWAASLSLGCNHCDDPQCALNCPVAAPKKDPDTGLVIQDTDMCIGCGKCILSCPYEAPAYDPLLDVVRKCDACTRHESFPACVNACSTRSLRFGEIESLEEEFSDHALTNSVSVLPDPSITHPNLLIIAKNELVK